MLTSWGGVDHCSLFAHEYAGSEGEEDNGENNDGGGGFGQWGER